MCPNCGSVDTYRSHRRPLEYLLLMFKPFRCRICRHRFYAYQAPEPAHETSSDE
jgi:predicted RNA-binding Zn-ribbon protein involved in translation (DUF1610 family)